MLRSYRSRFFAVHTGDHLSNQATSLESQTIPLIQYLPGQTLREELRAKSSVEGIEGGPNEALRAARELLRRWPEDPSGWTQLGRLYLAFGDLPAAEKATRAALSLDSTASAPWNNLGVILYETNRIEESIDAYRKALDCDPGNAGALINLSGPLRAAGKSSEAITVLRQATEIAPDKFNAWANFGLTLVQVGQSQDGLSALKRAYELAPDDHKAQIAKYIEGVCT